MLYSGCLPTALAENKGDAVSASLRERKWATQNHGFSLARRPPKDQGSSWFPSPMRVEFEPVPQQLLGKKKKKKKAPPPSQGLLLQGLTLSFAFGSRLSPWSWSLVLWAAGGELPMPQSLLGAKLKIFPEGLLVPKTQFLVDLG